MSIGFCKKRILIFSAAFATVIAIVATAVFLHPKNKIAQGVFVGDTHLGGMSLDAARKTILAATPKVPENIFIYTLGGKGIDINSAEIGLFADAQRTANAAFSKGRSGNIIKDAAELIKLRFAPEDIGYIHSFGEEKLSEIVYNFGVSVNGEHKDYILEYGDGDVLVKRGTPGQKRDVSSAITAIDYALPRGCHKIFVELKRETPGIANLRSLYDETYVEPQNATYEIINNRVIMVSEVVGRRIDMVEAANHMNKLRRGEDVRLSIEPLLPEVTLNDLNMKLFNHTLAQYTTAYSLSDRGRSANVALAAKKINGLVLAPGAVFSFNEVVGPRTTLAGFKSAPVFENGETVQGMGGGVCQVSSTLYSAALYADLEIVSRKNHSMTVAYVPKGQDATVSYGTIDFKFKNSMEYPIKIVASASGGKMSVSIMGTKPPVERVVKIVNNVVGERPPEVQEIQDESLDAGTRKVVSSGKTGYTVASSRIVYENGIQVKSERLENSVYKMVPAEVLVGTKLPEQTPEVLDEPVAEATTEEITEEIQPEELSGDETFEGRD